MIIYFVRGNDADEETLALLLKNGGGGVLVSYHYTKSCLVTIETVKRLAREEGRPEK